MIALITILTLVFANSTIEIVIIITVPLAIVFCALGIYINHRQKICTLLL